jgi:hypothetical protein
MIVKALRGGMQSISKSKSRSRSVFTASLVVIHLKRHQHYRSTAMRNTQVCHSCGAIERRGNDTLVTTTNLLFLPAAHRSRFLTADDKYLLPPQHSPTTRIYFHPHSFVPSHPQQTTQTTWMKFLHCRPASSPSSPSLSQPRIAIPVSTTATTISSKTKILPLSQTTLSSSPPPNLPTL